MSTPQIDHTKVKEAGLALLPPIQKALSSLGAIENEEDYLAADAKLGMIRNARLVWQAKISPILTPLKEAKRQLDLSMKGVKELNEEIDGRLQLCETEVKNKMRDFKLLEAQKKRDAEAEAERLRQEAIRLAEEAESKRGIARNKLLAKAEEATSAALEVQLYGITPDVKGSASSVREARKWRVKDMKAVLRGVLSGEIPPDVIVTDDTAIRRYWREDSAVVEAWPGFEGYDEITIARR